MEYNLKKHFGRTCIILKDDKTVLNKLSFEEVNIMSLDIANFLTKHIEKHSVVGLFFKTHHIFIPALVHR